MKFLFTGPYISNWRNLRDNIRHTPYFLKIWWAYRKVLWYDQDFDQAYCWALLAFKLRRMQQCMLNSAVSDRKLRAHQIGVTAALCERLRKEDYLFKFQHDAAPDFITVDWQHEEYLIKQDLEQVAMRLRRYSRMWWS